MQLTTALEGFWLSKARSVSQNTVNDYNHSYGRFIRFLADQHVEEIETVTPQHINAFLTWLNTDCGLAPKTILNHWIALSALWTWAEKELDLPHIIRGRIVPPRVRRQQPEPYTQVDVKRMLEACDQTDHWRTKPGVPTCPAPPSIDGGTRSPSTCCAMAVTPTPCRSCSATPTWRP
jgi:site-specific recombinase XerD